MPGWLIGVLLATGLTAGGSGAPQAAQPLWEQRFDGGIVDVSSPLAAPCIGVLTGGEVAVLGYDGATLWRRSFQKFSRVFQAKTVAVAPSCDWVVVTGTESYRYAWLLRRDGRDEYLGFGGVTPLSAAIHPDGHQIAITTGGRSLHVADADPFVVRNKISYASFGRLDYATADALLASGYGAGVIGSGNVVKWSEPGGVCDISVPGDAAWSVTACSPPHLSSVGAVTVRESDGAQRWSKVLDTAHAAAAPDGSFIAMLGADVTYHDFQERVGDRRLRLVRPDGSVLADVPAPEANIVGVTGAGLVILQQYRPPVILAFSKDGKQRATIELIDWPRGARVAGADRSTLLIWDERRLQAFGARFTAAPLR